MFYNHYSSDNSGKPARWQMLWLSPFWSLQRCYSLDTPICFTLISLLLRGCTLCIIVQCPLPCMRRIFRLCWILHCIPIPPLFLCDISSIQLTVQVFLHFLLPASRYRFAVFLVSRYIIQCFVHFHIFIIIHTQPVCVFCVLHDCFVRLPFSAEALFGGIILIRLYVGFQNFFLITQAVIIAPLVQRLFLCFIVGQFIQTAATSSPLWWKTCCILPASC